MRGRRAGDKGALVQNEDIIVPVSKSLPHPPKIKKGSEGNPKQSRIEWLENTDRCRESPSTYG